ncbi:MAG: sulfate adenylyltransferase [Desulforhopalus sp.]|jgi:sulfate adenylyltransferase
MNSYHSESLLVHFRRIETLRAEALDLQSIDLSPRQLCDLELLLNRGFYPLAGYLNKKEYNSVVSTMRLPDGEVWPMPINLDVRKPLAQTITKDQRIALNDGEGFLLAILTVDDVWQPDKAVEAK